MLDEEASISGVYDPPRKRNVHTVRRKVKEWLRRYAPAEILGTVTAVSGAFFAYELSGSYAAAAIAGTVCENIGYYGYFVVLELRRHYTVYRHHPPLRRTLVASLKTMRDMLVEFGPAELLDSFLVRPLFMFVGPQLLGSFVGGILLGKVAADVIFYAIAIIGYEFRKRWR